MKAFTSGCIRRVRLEEEPRSGGIVCRLADQVLERRGDRAVGMDALRHHRQLIRVADQDDRPRAGPEPRRRSRARSGSPRPRTGRRRRRRTRVERRASRCRPRRRPSRPPAPQRHRALPPTRVTPSMWPTSLVGLLDDAGRRPAPRSAASTTASSRLLIVLWDCAVTPTRFPCRTRSRIIRAPAYVLPVPGGPWIGSVPASSVQREPPCSIENILVRLDERPHRPATARRGGEAQRAGPGRRGRLRSPSMPSAMTASATRSIACFWTLLGSGAAPMRAPGAATSAFRDRFSSIDPRDVVDARRSCPPACRSRSRRPRPRGRSRGPAAGTGSARWSITLSTRGSHRRSRVPPARRARRRAASIVRSSFSSN